MRWLTIALLALLALTHTELWFGQGGVTRVVTLQNKLQTQADANSEARARNDQLVTELHDLKEGLEMVEEKARFELGMVKPNEILVQVATP